MRLPPPNDVTMTSVSRDLSAAKSRDIFLPVIVFTSQQRHVMQIISARYAAAGGYRLEVNGNFR